MLLMRIPFFTLAAVTVLVCSMILFQNAMYRKENKIAKEQKKEIEELNRMQNHFFLKYEP